MEKGQKQVKKINNSLQVYKDQKINKKNRIDIVTFKVL